jgi:hypothetical protein
MVLEMRARLVCPEEECSRVSFTETPAAIPPGRTGRCGEVAAAFGVAWHTAQTTLITAAAQWLPTSPPTRVLCIDETRARRVR